MGAVNIDNTGSGASVTLSSDGTDLLLNGSPIGGGGGGSSPITISNKTGAYTVVAGDLGTIINCTSGTFTVSLTAAATLGSGFNCWVWNTSSTTSHVITVDPSGSETIDGKTTLLLRRGEGMQIVCDGTNWQTGDKKTMRAYAENMSTADGAPLAGGGASIAIGSNAVVSDDGFGGYGVAIGRSTLSNGVGSLALGYSAKVTTGSGSSYYSTAIGANSGANGSVCASNRGAMALGGSYASGTDSFAAAVANNTSSYGATGANSVAMGDRAKASSSDAIAIGNVNSSTAFGSISIGINNLASSNAAFACGQGNTASATYSAAVGYYNEAQQAHSFVCGAYGRASVINKFVYGSIFIGGNGAAQYGLVPLVAVTTDATATVLTTSNAAPGTTNQVILPNNSAYAFTGIVVARQQASGGTASAAWKIEGLIRREGSAATTVLVNSSLTTIDNTPGWTLALSADTTNGGLAITATGAAATNIRWVATVQTSEVTYA